MHNPEATNQIPPLEQKFIDIKASLTIQQPGLVKYVESLIGLLHTNDGRIRLINGFKAVHDAMQDAAHDVRNAKLYWDYFCISMTTALEQGLPLNQVLITRTTPHDSNALTDYSQIEDIKSWGTVGFTHGHFRAPTPGSIAKLCIASELCGHLIVAAESNARTIQHKSPNIIFTDEQRLHILQSIADTAFIIHDGTDYSPQGFTHLVNQINPDIYFGNPRYPQSLRRQMRQIAYGIGAEFIEIYVPSPSTTRLLDPPQPPPPLFQRISSL